METYGRIQRCLVVDVVHGLENHVPYIDLMAILMAISRGDQWISYDQLCHPTTSQSTPIQLWL